MFYRLLPDKAGDKRFYPPEADLPTHSADGLLRVIRVGLTVYRLLPVYPYKQTSLPCVGMSQMCQHPTLLVHSITLSAVATSAGGTESPSCLAVLRLMDNSNLVTW